MQVQQLSPTEFTNFDTVTRSTTSLGKGKGSSYVDISVTPVNQRHLENISRKISSILRVTTLSEDEKRATEDLCQVLAASRTIRVYDPTTCGTGTVRWYRFLDWLPWGTRYMEKSVVEKARTVLEAATRKVEKDSPSGPGLATAAVGVGVKGAKVVGSALWRLAGGLAGGLAGMVGLRQIPQELQRNVDKASQLFHPYMGADKDKVHLVSVWGDRDKPFVFVTQSPTRVENFTVEVRKGTETEKTYSLSVDEKGGVTLQESGWGFRKKVMSFKTIEQALAELKKYGTPLEEAVRVADEHKAAAGETIGKFETLFKPQVKSASHAASELSRLEVSSNQVAFWPTKTETGYYYLSVKYKDKTKTYLVDFSKKGEVYAVAGDRRIKIELGEPVEQIVKTIILQDGGGSASDVLNPERIVIQLQKQENQQWATRVSSALGSSSFPYFVKKQPEDIDDIAKESGKNIGVLYLVGKDLMFCKQLPNMKLASAVKVVIDPDSRKISLQGEGQHYPTIEAFIQGNFSGLVTYKQAAKIADENESKSREEMLAGGRAAAERREPAAKVPSTAAEEVKKVVPPPVVAAEPPIPVEVAAPAAEALVSNQIILPTVPNDEIRDEFDDLINRPEDEVDFNGWLASGVSAGTISDGELVWLIGNYLTLLNVKARGGAGMRDRAVQSFADAINGRRNASALAKCLKEYQSNGKKVEKILTRGLVALLDSFEES